MNVDAIDVRDEVRVVVDPRFGASPVMVVRPIVGELLDGRQVDALRWIVLTLGPFGRLDPTLQVGELFLACAIAKRLN